MHDVGVVEYGQNLHQNMGIGRPYCEGAGSICSPWHVRAAAVRYARVGLCGKPGQPAGGGVRVRSRGASRRGSRGSRISLGKISGRVRAPAWGPWVLSRRCGPSPVFTSFPRVYPPSNPGEMGRLQRRRSPRRSPGQQVGARVASLIPQAP